MNMAIIITVKKGVVIMLLRIKKGATPEVRVNLLDVSATIVYKNTKQLPALLKVLCNRGWIQNKMPCRCANNKQG